MGSIYIQGLPVALKPLIRDVTPVGQSEVIHSLNRKRMAYTPTFQGGIAAAYQSRIDELNNSSKEHHDIHTVMSTLCSLQH